MFERLLEVLETTIVGQEMLITKQLQFIEGLRVGSSGVSTANGTLAALHEALERVVIRRLAIFQRL